MRRLRKKLVPASGDPLIPILNLVCMLIPLLLYGAVFVRFNTRDVRLEQRGDIAEAEPLTEALGLTVFVTADGFRIRANPRVGLPFATNDRTGEEGAPDIPRTDSGFDFDELTRRLEQVKDRHRKETRLYLGAEDDISYEVLLKAMDAARARGERALFPDITLVQSLV